MHLSIQILKSRMIFDAMQVLIYKLYLILLQTFVFFGGFQIRVDASQEIFRNSTLKSAQIRNP